MLYLKLALYEITVQSELTGSQKKYKITESDRTGPQTHKKSCGKTVSRHVCARRRLDGTSWDKNWDSHPALALRNEKDEGKERENRKGEKEILTALGFPSKASLSRTPCTGMEEPETTAKSIPTAIFMASVGVCAALMLSISKYLRGLTKTTTSLYR